MKTTVIGSGKTVTATSKADNNVTNSKKAEAISNTSKEGGLPVSTYFNGDSKKEEPGKTETAQPKSGVAKAEIKEQLNKEKPVLNLESTLKLVEELHRRKRQRDKLLSTISTLETFEVAQLDDAEETGSNHFQGCVLMIEDDENRRFHTKNPFLIKKVAEHINALCMDKLAEIEGEIFIP